MLHSRIIASILVKNGIAVQSYGYKRYLPVGSPIITAEHLCSWGADEIVLLDIDASTNNTKPDTKLVEQVRQVCNIPLTVGGGIHHMDDIAQLMHAGADKIVLNNAFLCHPSLVRDAAHRYGNQCIIISIDAKENSCGPGWKTYSKSAPSEADTDVISAAKKAQDIGAGEILLGSVDRDGTYEGYDLKLIEVVHQTLSIPIIAMGGAGKIQHFMDVLDFPYVAAAASNIFHHSEHSLALIKKAVRERGAMPRPNNTLAYANNAQRDDGRVLKRTDLTHFRLHDD